MVQIRYKYTHVGEDIIRGGERVEMDSCLGCTVEGEMLVLGCRGYVHIIPPPR